MQGVLSIYNKWAGQAAEYFVKESEYLPLPPYLPTALARQRACYVAMLENPGRRLRAIFGQALPTQPTLAQEIIVNTVGVLQQNPARPIRRPDLKQLYFSVALLGPLQRINDIQHLDPHRYGLYVRSDRNKTALLLPQRTGVETANDQIATALREANIEPKVESFTMYRFDVEYDDE
jgi:AMMECR1 domain-containing protein